jgi:hypothetical protein
MKVENMTGAKLALGNSALNSLKVVAAPRHDPAANVVLVPQPDQVQYHLVHTRNRLLQEGNTSSTALLSHVLEAALPSLDTKCRCHPANVLPPLGTVNDLTTQMAKETLSLVTDRVRRSARIQKRRAVHATPSSYHIQTQETRHQLLPLGAMGSSGCS